MDTAQRAAVESANTGAAAARAQWSACREADRQTRQSVRKSERREELKGNGSALARAGAELASC